MTFTFNQFQRELERRNIDPQSRFIFSELYSQQREMAKQIDAMANIIDQVVKTISNFTELHEATQGQVLQVKKALAGEVDGVELDSVPLTDDPTEH